MYPWQPASGYVVPRREVNITGLEVALLLNFKEATLHWKRVVRGRPEQEN